MTIRNNYAAESWDKVYSAFTQINFTSYDYDTIKESLLQYLKIYHAEHFNDFIESSELIAILELFAYVAELLAYRVDTMAHENFITTAQRKQSILRLARLISYRAARNIPARGLVKINTVRTSETIFDSLGNNLANISITWNDANNTNWKEQFFLVINKSLTTKFGQPSKSYQVGDVLMQLYTFNNQADDFVNGVSPFNVPGDGINMELVPVDIDENGPYERAPDVNQQFNIVYAADGKGDGFHHIHIYTRVGCGLLIVSDAPQRQTVPGAPYQVGGEQQCGENDEHDVIDRCVIHHDHKAAARAGEFDLVPEEQVLDELHESEGEDGEVDAPQPQSQGAHEKGNAKTCQTAHQDNKRNRELLPQDGRSIDADPKERGRRQRHVPRGAGE